MEKFNFSGCEALSFDEISTIEGGGIAYDLGHMAGTIALAAIIAFIL